MQISIKFSYSNGKQNKYEIKFSRKTLFKISKVNETNLKPVYTNSHTPLSKRERMIKCIQDSLGGITSPNVIEHDNRFYYIWNQNNNYSCGIAALLNIYQCSSIESFIDDILPNIQSDNVEDIEVFTPRLPNFN